MPILPASDRKALMLDCGTSKMDEAACNHERELTEFFEHAPFGLGLVSADGVILSVNRTEAQMLGYTKEEILGRRISEFHLKGLATDLLDRCARGEPVRDYEVRLRWKDGSVVDALVNTQLQQGPGQLLRIVKWLQDISRWRIAESQLNTRPSQQAALATLATFAASQENLKAVLDFAVKLIAQTLHAPRLCSCPNVGADCSEFVESVIVTP